VRIFFFQLAYNFKTKAVEAAFTAEQKGVKDGVRRDIEA
jgi:hypothetical protein